MYDVNLSYSFKAEEQDLALSLTTDFFDKFNDVLSLKIASTFRLEENCSHVSNIETLVELMNLL